MAVFVRHCALHSGSVVVAVQHGRPDGLEGQVVLLALVSNREHVARDGGGRDGSRRGAGLGG